MPPVTSPVSSGRPKTPKVSRPKTPKVSGGAAFTAPAPTGPSRPIRSGSGVDIHTAFTPGHTSTPRATVPFLVRLFGDKPKDGGGSRGVSRETSRSSGKPNGKAGLGKGRGPLVRQPEHKMDDVKLNTATGVLTVKGGFPTSRYYVMTRHINIEDGRNARELVLTPSPHGNVQVVGGQLSVRRWVREWTPTTRPEATRAANGTIRVLLTEQNYADPDSRLRDWARSEARSVIGRGTLHKPPKWAKKN